jgi:DNA-binding LacI/PurR family transcriptional regulator
LTTLAQPTVELGKGAMEIVLAVLAEKPDNKPITNVMVAARLVVRASSG